MTSRLGSPAGAEVAKKRGLAGSAWTTRALDPGQRYAWQVTAVNPSGRTNSARRTFTVKAPPLLGTGPCAAKGVQRAQPSADVTSTIVCTLAVFSRILADLPLVVAANRDELYARPAEGPTLLSSDPLVVGGRDVVAGGSWLATSEHGLVVGILNRRTSEAPDPRRASRGALCVQLARAGTVAAAAEILSALDPTVHNPFNVLVADRLRAVVAQNRNDGMALQELPPGTHLLTNLDLNDPTCRRISRSSQRFQQLAESYAQSRDRSALVAGLHAVLGDHQTALDDRAPTDQLCIHSEVYGTRSSSLLLATATTGFDFLHTSGAPCRGVYRRIALPWQ